MKKSIKYKVLGIPKTSEEFIDKALQKEKGLVNIVIKEYKNPNLFPIDKNEGYRHIHDKTNDYHCSVQLKTGTTKFDYKDFCQIGLRFLPRIINFTPEEVKEKALSKAYFHSEYLKSKGCIVNVNITENYSPEELEQMYRKQQLLVNQKNKE